MWANEIFAEKMDLIFGLVAFDLPERREGNRTVLTEHVIMGTQNMSCN